MLDKMMYYVLRRHFNSSYISLSLGFVNFLITCYASRSHMQYEFRFQNSE